MPRHIALLLVAWAAAGCAGDLRQDYPFDGQVSTGPLVEVQPQEDGSRVAVVDATNKASQVFFDIEAGREMKAEEAFDTNAWDLAFQRFRVSMNGGGGNPTGRVQVAVLKGVAWEALTVAPSEGYQQDASETVFNGYEGGWYTYNIAVHRLVPREDLLYVVRGSEGRYFKLRMLSYYDDAGTPARLSFLYQELEAPGS